MEVRPYLEQAMDWPESGEHTMANYDYTSIVVYQAYRYSIANFAVEKQVFGGDFIYQ